MFLRKVFFLFLLLARMGSSAQPLIGFYLGTTYEPSKGRDFLKIEETYELILRGVNPLPSKTEMQFNPQGNIVSERHFSNTGGLTREIMWEYLPGGQFMTLKHSRYFVNMLGWQEEFVRVQYEANTNMPTEITVEKNGKLNQWATITTDSLNRIVSVQVFDARKAHIFTEQLAYIESSNMIKVTIYKPNGQVQGTWNYRWDQRKRYYFSTLKRKYNNEGDVVLETLSSATRGDQAYFYEYQYDSNNNWVLKETYQVALGRGDKVKKKKLEHRIRRSITYQ